MSDPEGCNEFLAEFVLPFVAGGPIHIGKPIDEPTLEEYERDLPHASVPLIAIDEAREVVLSKLVVSAPTFIFDADELYLAAAVHNLLYLCHPDSDSWGVSQSARDKVVASAQKFAARPRTGNRTRVLARHSLLHNIFDITRTDVKVSWWTGSQTFLGQKAPKRLMRWSGVRRVNRDETTVGFRDLFGSADVAAVVGTLLRRSPLSQLLLHSAAAPHLHWEDVVFLLRDAELARIVAYNAVSPAGLYRADRPANSPADVIRTPARLAASFDQMLERSPKEEDVRTVAAFLVYLNGLLALDELNLTEQSPLISAVLSKEQRPRGLTTFFALPGALSLVDPRLDTPPGIIEEPDLGARWQVHRSQSQGALGEGAIEGLADRIRRHLTVPLPTAPVDQSAFIT